MSADTVWLPTVEDFTKVASAVLDRNIAPVENSTDFKIAQAALDELHEGIQEETGTKEEMLFKAAATLFYKMIRHRPLPDGNKRTGYAFTIMFLGKNGYRWQQTTGRKPAEMIKGIMASKVDIAEISTWLEDNSTKA